MVWRACVDIFLETGARLAVVAECVKGGGRNGIDRIGADQFFDIQHVAIGGIFRAGAGPEEALRLAPRCARACQRGPLEDFLVALIGEFGVGDGDFALQAAAERRDRSRVRRILDALGESGCRRVRRCG